jgi:hypothetical protein
MGYGLTLSLRCQQSFEDAIIEIRKSVGRFQKIEGKPWGAEGAVIEFIEASWPTCSFGNESGRLLLRRTGQRQ